MKRPIYLLMLLASLFCFTSQSCTETTEMQEEETAAVTPPEAPEYFQLRPELEQAFGYTHAVKIGPHIKISGAVSMDAQGTTTGVGDMAQQMKNCYADLEKILTHYNCTFDDVVKEDIFTTNMAKFLEAAAYRSEIYTNQFPTGTWLGVQELASPDMMIEIELEVYKP